MTTRRTLLLVPALALLLVLAACGDDDSSDDGAEEAPSETTTGDDQAASPETSAGGNGPGDLAAETGRVTIGDTTWEIVADIQCLDFGVALGFQGHAVDDPEVLVALDANIDDPSANSAQVDLGDETDWRAGDTYVDLGATIPEVTAEDGYGTGTATFVNINSQGQTAEGSYEFYCG